MSPTYLKSLCYGVQVARLVELEEFWLPGWLLRWRILDPMLLACQGSIAAACLALELGWAVNLSGGFHHASYSEGGGFCIYPDISMVVHYLQSRLRIQKIMIIDLDAHQGNGF
jgi:histone deacetylase 11